MKHSKIILLFCYVVIPLTIFNNCTNKTKFTDACETVECLNDDFCIGGECDCPGGYSGSNCEIVDSCYNVICFNDGFCINGECDCPVGYSGSDCSFPLIPTSLTITKIEVNNYPTLKTDNSSWDFSSGADAFITLNSGTIANQANIVSNTIDDVTGQTLTYNTTGFPFELLTPNSNWTLAVWDDDGATNNNEHMAGVYFVPNDNRAGFPSTFQVNTNSIIATIYVNWNF